MTAFDKKIQLGLPSKRRLTGILVAAVAIAAIAAASTEFSHPSSLFEQPNKEIVNQQEKIFPPMSAAWDNYPLLKDLAGNSTDVVVGQVTSVKAVDVSGNWPLTDYNFEISSAIKGDLQKGDTITIRQTGAATAKQVAELSDDPLLKEGEAFLGFLRYSQEYDVYAIIGGPQGRFLIQNDAVNSLDVVNPDSMWVPIKVKDKALGQFTLELKAEMATQ